MTERTYNFLLIVLLMVMTGAVSIMSTDLYTPSMPDLTGYFDTSATAVKLTISLNLLAFGAGQLVFGPLSDRFGRRPVILAALCLFIAASMACAVSRSIGELIAARVLQGLVASAEAVICIAVFKDLFTEREQVKAFAIYGMVVAIAPAVAPIAGGYIHTILGWRYNFWVTAAAGTAALVALSAYLPESHNAERGALGVGRVLATYSGVLRNRTFVMFSCLLGSGFGMIYVFITGAPFILIRQLGIPTEHFGYYQAVIVLCFIAGSTLASRLADRWDPMQILNLGIAVITMGCVMLFARIFIFELTAWSFTAAFCLMTAGMGPLFAVTPAKAMAAVHSNAGSAAAVMGAIEIIIPGFAAGFVSIFHDGTARPVGYSAVGLVVALIAFSWAANRRAASPGVGTL